MDALDGNAIAGTLITVFGTEMTTASGTCTSCGTHSMLGEFGVYLRAPGIVVRCRHCGSVVMVFVEAHGVTCVDLRGLAALEPGVIEGAGSPNAGEIPSDQLAPRSCSGRTGLAG